MPEETTDVDWEIDGKLAAEVNPGQHGSITLLDRIMARKAVWKALRRGKLTRQRHCERCGRQAFQTLASPDRHARLGGTSAWASVESALSLLVRVLVHPLAGGRRNPRAMGMIESHHPSYAKSDRLNIVWLCKSCHRDADYARGYCTLHDVLKDAGGWQTLDHQSRAAAATARGRDDQGARMDSSDRPAGDPE